jgi:hypothetical protein
MDTQELQKQLKQRVDHADKVLEEFKAQVVEEIGPELTRLEQRIPTTATQIAQQATSVLEARLNVDARFAQHQQQLNGLQQNVGEGFKAVDRQLAIMRTEMVEQLRAEGRVLEGKAAYAATMAAQQIAAPLREAIKQEQAAHAAAQQALQKKLLYLMIALAITSLLAVGGFSLALALLLR